jgi:hypothetical protein
MGAEVLADLLLEGDLVVQCHQDGCSLLSATAVPTGNQPLEIGMGFTSALEDCQLRGSCSGGL